MVLPQGGGPADGTSVAGKLSSKGAPAEGPGSIRGVGVAVGVTVGGSEGSTRADPDGGSGAVWLGGRFGAVSGGVSLTAGSSGAGGAPASSAGASGTSSAGASAVCPLIVGLAS